MKDRLERMKRWRWRSETGRGPARDVDKHVLEHGMDMMDGSNTAHILRYTKSSRVAHAESETAVRRRLGGDRLWVAKGGTGGWDGRLGGLNSKI